MVKTKFDLTSPCPAYSMSNESCIQPRFTLWRLLITISHLEIMTGVDCGRTFTWPSNHGQDSWKNQRYKILEEQTEISTYTEVFVLYEFNNWEEKEK